MSFPNVRIATTSVTRQRTPALWKGVPESYAKVAPELGTFYWEDFTDQAFANTTDASAAYGWFIQNANAGGTDVSFVSTASPDGLATLSATTGTDSFGVEAHRGGSATTLGTVNLPTHATDPRGTVVYETYVDFDASDNWFCGMTEPIVEFLSATGTLPTTSDYIGFYRADGGALQFVCANDNAGGTAVTDSETLIATASVPTGLTKLGFRVNPDSSVQIFVDEVEYKVNTSGTAVDINPLALPIESLTQKYATTRGATADLATVTLIIDWVGTFVGV